MDPAELHRHALALQGASLSTHERALAVLSHNVNLLVWVQASSSCTYFNKLEFAAFVKRFECIFDQPDHSGCASDRLFEIQQGSCTVARYANEFGMLAEEAA